MTDNPTPTNSTLRELAEAATSGEWKTFDFHRVETAKRDAMSGVPVDICTVEEGVDAAWITAANPARILALLDERDKLAGEVESLTEDHLMPNVEIHARGKEIESLRTQLSEVTAERDAAYEGLKPFAAMAHYWLERDDIHGLDDDDTCATEIRFADLRKAAQLIQSKEGA